MLNINLEWVDLVHPEIMPGRYMISENGDIYSKETKKILKPFIDKDGYKRIELTVRPKKYKKFFVHRLVAMTFIPGQTEERNQVNHINSIRHDSRRDNLEWVSISENAIHGYKYGYRKHNTQKYDEELIESICEKIAMGYKNSEILYLLTGDKTIDNNKSLYMLISHIRSKDNWTNISDRYF
jgi:hypothetical protein